MTLRIEQPYTQTIIDEVNIVAAVSETVFLGALPIRLSVQSNITNSASATSSFIDGVRSTGTVTITSYAAAHLTAATPSATITYGTPDDTDTVILTNLPAGSPVTFTKVAAAPGATEFTNIAGLTALIDALTDVNATDNGTVITITVVTAGTAMNSATVTGTGTFSALSITFSGGINAAVVTVDGTALTEGVDWTAETSNDVTADNLAVAIDAIAAVTAANPAAAIITVRGASVGTAGNVTTTVTGTGVTVQQATLTGGVNSDVVGTPAFSITETAHGYSTGLKVNYDVVGGTTIDNLVNNTDYFIIKVDANTVQLATSLANAIAGTEIEINNADNAVGGGSFTLTPEAITATIRPFGSNDGVNFVALASATNITATSNTMLEFSTPTFKVLRIAVVVSAGEINIEVVTYGKTLY